MDANRYAIADAMSAADSQIEGIDIFITFLAFMAQKVITPDATCVLHSN